MEYEKEQIMELVEAQKELTGLKIDEIRKPLYKQPTIIIPLLALIVSIAGFIAGFYKLETIEGDSERSSVEAIAVASEQADTKPEEHSCEYIRKNSLEWKVACNNKTTIGFYWQVGIKRVKEYGHFGLSPAGNVPECNENSIGHIAYTASWKFSSQWRAVSEKWYRNFAYGKKGDEGNEGEIYHGTPNSHTGVYKATCKKYQP